MNIHGALRSNQGQGQAAGAQRQQGPAPLATGQPRAANHPPRQVSGHRERRNRQPVQRSATHRRLPATNGFPQQAQAVGRGVGSGRNLMALFGDEIQPRTMYPLAVDRARTGRFAAEGYPSGDVVLPAGLTLADIVSQYPNHVWGAMLRVFLAEGWAEEDIWRALPPDARHNNAQERPWNYLQQASGREIDRMFTEQTGIRRRVKRRTEDEEEDSGQVDDGVNQHDGDNDVAGPHQGAAGAHQTNFPTADIAHRRAWPEDITLDDFMLVAVDERQRALEMLFSRYRAIHPMASGDVWWALARDRLDNWHITHGQQIRRQFAFLTRGWVIAGEGLIDLLSTLWELHNPWDLTNLTLDEYLDLAVWWGWRQYCALLQDWTRSMAANEEW